MLRQPEEEVHPLCLAPGHDVLATKAGVATNDNLHLRPTGTDLGEDAGEFFNTAGGRIDVGLAQPGAQQVLAAKDVQRQVAVVT